MAKTLVIAEPGCTHEGDKATMLRLLDTAKACGADVFKPQWVSDVDQMLARRQMKDDVSLPAMSDRFANAAEEYDYYKRAYTWLSFPVRWHIEFRDRCDVLGLAYGCTAYLPQDVATLAPFIDYLKISSFEADDDDLFDRAITAMPEPHLRVMVSTGMQDGRLIRLGCRLLHCVSSYPTPLEELNLAVLGPNDDGGWEYDGLSDHSGHVLTGAVAVGAGASVIEAHFRLDDCHPENPDYAVAFTPDGFAHYIQNIRDAEHMMGDWQKRVQPCEQAMLKYKVTA